MRSGLPRAHKQKVIATSRRALTKSSAYRPGGGIAVSPRAHKQKVIATGLRAPLKKLCVSARWKHSYKLLSSHRLSPTAANSQRHKHRGSQGSADRKRSRLACAHRTKSYAYRPGGSTATSCSVLTENPQEVTTDDGTNTGRQKSGQNVLASGSSSVEMMSFRVLLGRIASNAFASSGFQ